MIIDIVCEQRCGFRSDQNYFVRKPKFAPGICPSCNSPIDYVRENSNEPVLDHEMVLADKDSRGQKGQVVGILERED